MERVTFAATANLETDELRRMRRALEEISARPIPWPCPVSRAVRDVLSSLALWAAGASLREAVQVAEISTEDLLDAAAGLLEASGLLIEAGFIVEGFAVEGIEGRLLEAALGVGRVEPAQA